MVLRAATGIIVVIVSACDGHVSYLMQDSIEDDQLVHLLQVRTSRVVIGETAVTGEMSTSSFFKRHMFTSTLVLATVLMILGAWCILLDWWNRRSTVGENTQQGEQPSAGKDGPRAPSKTPGSLLRGIFCRQRQPSPKLKTAQTAKHPHVASPVELSMSASDMEGFVAVSRMASARLLKYADAVEGGNWGEPVSASEKDGHIYKLKLEDHQTTVYLGVLTFPDAEGTLEQLMKASTVYTLEGYLSNGSVPCRSDEVLTFKASSISSLPKVAHAEAAFSDVEISLVHSQCCRRCIVIELERCSQDIHTRFTSIPYEKGERYVSSIVSTNTPAIAKTLRFTSPGLLDRLAEQASALAGPNGTYLINHLSGCVIQKASPKLWRVSYVMQVDPVAPVPLLPRWALELEQHFMMQDVCKGVVGHVAHQQR